MGVPSVASSDSLWDAGFQDPERLAAMVQAGSVAVLVRAGSAVGAVGRWLQSQFRYCCPEPCEDKKREPPPNSGLFCFYGVDSRAPRWIQLFVLDAARALRGGIEAVIKLAGPVRAHEAATRAALAGRAIGPTVDCKKLEYGP